MENLNALAVEIREIGLANGWNLVYRPDWTSSDYHVPAMLALIHSEISEAYDAVNGGDRDDLAAEFADIVIRVLDLAGGLTEDFAAHVARIESTFISDDDDERAFNFLHQMTTYALEAFRDDNLLKFLGVLALILYSVDYWAADFDIDIGVAVLEKMDVNRHRSHRHGGKRV